jgi:hypothetical protein
MRLRFTIRDLLWLTALVAMGMSWWVDRRNLAANLAARDKYANELSRQWTEELRGYKDREAELRRQIHAPIDPIIIKEPPTLKSHTTDRGTF